MAEYIERVPFAELVEHLDKSKLCRDCYHLAVCDAWVRYGTSVSCPCYIPTADVVEVRHGEWLPYPSDAYMKCSVCGMEYHKSRMPDVVGYCPNPNCGAKMDGKGE